MEASLLQSLKQVLFGDIIPEAYFVEDIGEGSFCYYLVCGDGDVMFAQLCYFLQPYMTATLSDDFVIQRIEKPNDIIAADLR